MNLNARAAARLLGVTENRIYEWVAQGDLPAYKVQEQLRFNRVELLEWATARRIKVSPDLFDDERAERRSGNGGASGFALSRALEAGGIHRDLAVTGAKSALRALAAILPLPGGIERESIVALFAAGSGITPVGRGIAIPHARCPIVLPVATSVVALGFLAKPLAVTTPDGKPIEIVFAMLSPTIRAHLDALSRLASALLDEDVHALIERRAPDAAILERLRAVEAAAAAKAKAPDPPEPTPLPWALGPGGTP